MTPHKVRPHNARVRRLVALALAVLAPASLLNGAGIAPLHAHSSSAHGGGVTVHQHVAPHHQSDRGTSGSEIERDEQVIWLAVAAVHALPLRAAAPAAVLTRIFIPLPQSIKWSPIVLQDAAPPHGPPRSAASLRAPPAFPV